ncbi:MAG: hypothetical protein KatS3mg045_0287 [Bellilinea sp.]|nr:MAG: hypothetical protein KatS3mg045_0287 [Bellilinea sp.]
MGLNMLHRFVNQFAQGWEVNFFQATDVQARFAGAVLA